MVVLPETAVVVTVTFEVPVGVPGFPGVVLLPPPPPQPETTRTTMPAISIEVFHNARFRGRTNSTKPANDNPLAPPQFIRPYGWSAALLAGVVVMVTVDVFESPGFTLRVAGEKLHDASDGRPAHVNVTVVEAGTAALAATVSGNEPALPRLMESDDTVLVTVKSGGVGGGAVETVTVTAAERLGL